MATYKYLFSKRVHSQKWGIIEPGCLIELNDDTDEGRKWLHEIKVASLYEGPRRGDNLPADIRAMLPPTEAELMKQRANNIFTKMAGGTLPPRPEPATEAQQSLMDSLDLAVVPPTPDPPVKTSGLNPRLPRMKPSKYGPYKG